MAEESRAARLRMDGPAHYRIIVQGRLDERLSGRLGGLAITVFDTEEKSALTVLSGELMDQAALFGVLNTLYERHLPLIAVVEMERCELTHFFKEKEIAYVMIMMKDTN